MDAFGVVYPQYWLQPVPEIKFVTYLIILKVALYQLKKVKFNEIWVPR
jgi:hypothetical protein